MYYINVHYFGFAEEPWLVGCHGDCWVNNLMFKYDDRNVPEDVTLLDLQLYREACPTTDLLYFTFSSLTYETRKKYETQLLRIYYQRYLRVCNSLKGTQMPGFTFQRLQRRYRAAKWFGVFLALPVLSIILSSPETAVDMDTMDKEENGNIADMFETIITDGSKNNDLFKDRFGGLLKELYEDGVI